MSQVEMQTELHPCNDPDRQSQSNMLFYRFKGISVGLAVKYGMCNHPAWQSRHSLMILYAIKISEVAAFQPQAGDRIHGSPSRYMAVVPSSATVPCPHHHLPWWQPTSDTLHPLLRRCLATGVALHNTTSAPFGQRRGVVLELSTILGTAELAGTASICMVHVLRQFSASLLLLRKDTLFLFLPAKGIRSTWNDHLRWPHEPKWDCSSCSRAVRLVA